MKIIPAFIVCCIALVTSLMANAQDGQPPVFFQSIDVSTYKGASFTIECWMYAERTENNSGTALMALGYNQQTQVSTAIGKLSMEDFKAGEWNRLTVSGKIDKRTQSLFIGALYSGKARFFFDDMKLFINKKEVPVKNAGFEDTDLSAWKFINQPSSVKVSVTAQLVHGDKQALSIDASEIVSLDYGNNERTGKYATINGNRIYYEEYGEGQPLLLLHGALESIRHYEKQIPALAQSFRVIAVDTRGHGKSTADTTRLTYELYADDMYKLLNELKLDSVDVLGWSDGGITGLILAMCHPEKVKKLAAMGANLYPDTTALYGWLVDTIQHQIKVIEAEHTPSNAFALRVNRCMLEEPHIDPSTLRTIQCPVLVMAGEHDVIKEAHTRLIAASIPGAELVIIKNASHYAPIEVPDEFNKQVETFLKKP
ncbi:alpha/beta hydrolase fold protein [Chitinophaga pinensis DSM 2588]|uniref:Alpha/beta hydrolase fold protein n=2 Tax=Chitinophaga pinensis TaxID=79329 RepID=A0A979GBR7_CHIPD|nr:alpha/beta hydrolase fold protein [Chitinophaga pinensis DSM 2588]